MFKLLLLIFTTQFALANKIPPTANNFSYGDHPRQVMDVWLPTGFSEPAKCVFWMHGGGFLSGSNRGFRNETEVIQNYLDNNFAIFSLNYPLLPYDDKSASPADLTLQDIMYDVARAVQVVRYQSKSYNLDPNEIIFTGSSAGGGTGTWLSTHDDIADPRAEDPVLRQSSKPNFTIARAMQFTYDLTRWEEVMSFRLPADVFSEHPYYLAYAASSYEELYNKEFSIMRKDLDMVSMVDKKDTPLVLMKRDYPTPPLIEGHIHHHQEHAFIMHDAYQKAGAKSWVVQVGTQEDKQRDFQRIIFKRYKIK